MHLSQVREGWWGVGVEKKGTRFSIRLVYASQSYT